MAGYRSGRSSGSNRRGGYRRSSGTGTRSRRAVSSRRRTSRSTGGSRTLRLVIEQAAPTPTVAGPDGYLVPNNTPPRRAKF